MRIGLDFDGVISNSLPLKNEVAKRLFGKDIPPEQFKKELVVDTGLLTLEEYRTVQREVYGSPELGSRMVPVAGVLESVARLLADGHEIRVITSRDGEMLEVARTWAQANGLSLPFTGLGHGVSKAEAATGLHLFVDDDLDKLEPLVDVVPHRVLFSWFYNEHLDESGVATRVKTWEQLLETVAALATVPAA